VHARADELIRTLRLQPHREGGHFSEVFRSRRCVRIEGAGGTPVERSALTTIYFLLAEGEVSRWHRLDADEIWHFYEGKPLELFLLDEKALVFSRVRLGPAASGAASAPGTAQLPAFVQVVPAGSWLAARPAGPYALVGCSMGPGFEYEGLTLMKDEPAVAVEVARRFPEAAQLI
jgi:predicted cupin superfamily sugar epimerase